MQPSNSWLFLLVVSQTQANLQHRGFCFVSVYERNELSGMTGNVPFCCPSPDMSALHQRSTLTHEDPESFTGRCPLKSFKFTHFLFYCLPKPFKLRM